MSPEVLGVVGLVVGGVGIVIGVAGLFVARFFWSHESPRLRSERKAEKEADRQFLRQEFEAFAVELQEKTWKSEHPGQTIPEPVMAEFFQVAQATSSTLFLASFGDRLGITDEVKVKVTKGPGAGDKSDEGKR